ncbi:MAG: ArsR/SmtB family transcription factor [Rhodospirillaceae bacterium]
MQTPIPLDAGEFQARSDQAAALLKAMAHPKRLMILCRLNGAEVSVNTLVQESTLSQSALSQHLQKLRDQGLVETRREGTRIYYRLADPAVAQIIATLMAIYCPELVADAPVEATEDR